MNTEHHYARRDDRILTDPSDSPEPAADEMDVSRFATHHDPSLTTSPIASAPPGSGSGLAWVRPTELAATIGATPTRRAIDLETELARRLRRTPVTATRAVYGRAQRHVTARPSQGVIDRPATQVEGPGLA